MNERVSLYLRPDVCFGKPTIGPSRLYVQIVAEAWWYGATEQEIYTSWPSCSGKPGLLLACWWMARYGSRTWRQRWGKWLEAEAGNFWACAPVALPPQIDVKVKA